MFLESEKCWHTVNSQMKNHWIYFLKRNYAHITGKGRSLLHLGITSVCFNIPLNYMSLLGVLGESKLMNLKMESLPSTLWKTSTAATHGIVITPPELV